MIRRGEMIPPPLLLVTPLSNLMHSSALDAVSAIFTKHTQYVPSPIRSGLRGFVRTRWSSTGVSHLRSSAGPERALAGSLMAELAYGIGLTLEVFGAVSR